MYKLVKEEIVSSSTTTETIVAHAFVSDHSSLLVAVVLSDDTLVVLHELADGRREVARLPWCDRHGARLASWSPVDGEGAMSSVTISPNGRWIACMLSNGSVEIVPTQLLIPSMQSTHSNETTPLFPEDEICSVSVKTRDDCLRLPTCAVWYETTHSRRPILVYSNKGGDILIVDLLIRKLCISLQAPQSIHHLDVVTDATNDVFLLVTGFAGTQWLVPLEVDGQSVRETLSKVIPSDLRELPTNGSVVSSIVSRGTRCLGLLVPDKNVLQIYNTVSLQNPAVEVRLPENTWSVHFADTMVFSLRNQTEIVCAVNFSMPVWEMSAYESAHERFQETVGTLPECRFLGFVPLRLSSADGKTTLPQCLLVSENGLFRLSPQCTILELFARCLTPKLDLSTAESLCSSLCVSFEKMCAHAVEFVLKSVQQATDPSLTVEVALRLCDLGKIPTLDQGDLFESHGVGGFILSTLVSRSQNEKLDDADSAELATRIVRIFVAQVGRYSPGFERNRLESDFRHFLLRNQYYSPERSFALAFDARLWSSVAVLLRLHDLARPAALAFLKLRPWPVDDSFVRAVAFRNFGHLLVGDTDIACEFFVRIAEYAVQLVEKTHLATLGALASPMRIEISRILEENRSEDENLIRQAARAYFTCAIRCAHDSTVIEDDSTQDESNLRRSLACGANHSVMIAQDGVYFWGKLQTKKRVFSVSQRGPLGGAASSQHVATESPMEQCSLPQRLALSTKVVSVAAGAEFLLLLTAEGGLLGLGSNRLGQLGMGHRDAVAAPMPVDFEQGVCIAAITCGQYHSAAITSSGSVYTWGWGVHGQLGLAERIRLEDALSPMQVQSLPGPVTSVACGYAHTIFLTTSGQLLVCGNDSYGQLGLGGGCKRAVPMAIEAHYFAGEQVRLVATGLFHSVAVTASGRMFTWGSTPQALKFKALLQKRKNAAAAEKKSAEAACNGSAPIEGTHLRPLEVQLTGALETRRDKIVQLECGFYHSALITDAGHLYTWGKSLEFQLGHGDKKERQSPVLVTNVSDTCQWRSVSCGSEFTMATDRHGMVWGWGRNDLSQLGFESLQSGETSKLAGKVLTIQRPNRGQRTITLPSDNRAFVAVPKRLDGLSVCDAAFTGGLSVQVPTDDMVLSAFKLFGAQMDVANTAHICEQFGAAHLCPFVWLLSGDVAASINARANRMESSGLKPEEGTVAQDLVDFYEPFVHKIADNDRRIEAALSFINKLPVPPSLIEAAIARNLPQWASIIAAILRSAPDELKTFPASLKLQSLRMFEAQTHADQPTVDRVEISQEEALIADRSVVYFSACGHAMADRTLQASLGELQTRHELNSALPRTARLAQDIYSIDTHDVTKLRRTDCTLCPKCLDNALRDVANEIVA